MINQHADLPPDLLHLARRLARDCACPGTYTITLTVPPNHTQPLIAEIARLLPVATVEAVRRSKRPLNNR